MSAMLRQICPQTVLIELPGHRRGVSEMVSTNLPA